MEQALTHPYFQSLHNPETEPSAAKAFDFEFEVNFHLTAGTFNHCAPIPGVDLSRDAGLPPATLNESKTQRFMYKGSGKKSVGCVGVSGGGGVGVVVGAFRRSVD